MKKTHGRVLILVKLQDLAWVMEKSINDAAQNINNLAIQNHLLITSQEIHNVNKLNSKKN